MKPVSDGRPNDILTRDDIRLNAVVSQALLAALQRLEAEDFGRQISGAGFANRI
ncbi:hypothetical protein OHA21_41750 [Actinoplanes sp. NBC_00393]|uniref:hypothetical protein n=1 Tax=Actinoplanes sp. NBC_00393 TaxID=2975953 RepID=UPI002E203BA7